MELDVNTVTLDQNSIYSLLDRIDLLAQEHAWDAIEQTCEQWCTQLAGEQQTRQIQAIDLSVFRTELRAGLQQAMQRAHQLESQAIYFEYNMENGWHGGFFLCPIYAVDGNDDWAMHFDEHVEGPGIPEFSEIYAYNGFDRSATSIGSTIFMIGRTMAAFGRVAVKLQEPTISLCLGFHDQTPLTRICA